MNSKKKQREAHKCPPIPASWNTRITGPAHIDGEPVDSANAKWSAFKRLVANSAKPMPRRTH